MRPAARRADRKRRTRGHVIADLAVNYVERQALLCGYVVERVRRDYGIDLKLFTYDAAGHEENGEVHIQVKATDRLVILRGHRAATIPIERGDLAAWLGNDEPVILVVYDARRDAAYWLYVQAYFQRQPDFRLENAPAKVTVRLGLDRLLNPAAVRKFAVFRDRVVRQQRRVRHDDQ